MVRLDEYAEDFNDTRIPAFLSEQAETVSEAVESSIFSSDLEHARIIYSLVRAMAELRLLGQMPENITVVETGTGNGVFTLSIALGVADSKVDGHIWTVDLPFEEGDSLEQHREKLWGGFMGCAIPEDREVGWLLDEYEGAALPQHITKSVGKVQKIFPPLFDPPCPLPDVWVFDSGHDMGTQTFELEFAANYGAEHFAAFLDDDGWQGIDVAARVADKYNLEYTPVPGPAALLTTFPVSL